MKEEIKLEATTDIHTHTNSNNNHKLKLINATSKDNDIVNRKDSIHKAENYNSNHTRPSHLLIPPCLISGSEGKTNQTLDDSRVLVKQQQIISEESLRQNGQSVSSLSVSSVNSDRSSSRDRLSDVSNDVFI